MGAFCPALQRLRLHRRHAMSAALDARTTGLELDTKLVSNPMHNQWLDFDQLLIIRETHCTVPSERASEAASQTDD